MTTIFDLGGGRQWSTRTTVDAVVDKMGQFYLK